MSVYTAQEYANMHLIYGECRCNASAAARLYRQRYPNAARHPDHRVFGNVNRSLSEGRFPSQVHSEGRSRLPYDDIVLQAVAEDPSTSIRQIEASTGVPKSVAHRILKSHDTHTTSREYKLYYPGTISQELRFVKRCYKDNGKIHDS